MPWIFSLGKLAGDAIAWVALLAFDLVIFCLTVYKIWVLRFEHVFGGFDGLLEAMLRDGTFIALNLLDIHVDAKVVLSRSNLLRVSPSLYLLYSTGLFHTEPASSVMACVNAANVVTFYVRTIQPPS